MPATPTREQFNAATKKVMETAPAGLSRDDFYSLVDKELVGATTPTAEEMLTHTGRMSPQYRPQESEPDTWMGGFIRGLRKEFVDPLVKSDVAKSAESPRTAGDILQLLIPSAIGMGSANEFIPAAKNLASGAAEGAANREGLKKVPAVIKGMWKRATEISPSTHIGDAERKWFSEGHVPPDITSVPDGGIPQGELPTSSASEIDHYLPNKSGVSDRGIPQGELPTSSASEVDAHLPNRSGYVPGAASRNTTLRVGDGPVADRYMPNASGVPDRGIDPGEMPTASASEVDRYLPSQSGTPDRGIPQDALPTSSASEVDRFMPNQGGTPDTGITQGEMPQGTPPVELQSIQDVLMRDALSKADAAAPIQTDRVPYGGVEVPHRIKKTRMGKEVANPFGKDEVAPVEGEAPQTPDVTVTSPDSEPRMTLKEWAETLRRMHGSRDGGRMLTPHDPKGGAELLKQLAPGPSRLPIVAEQRINAMPQDQTLEDALRDIITSRSKLPPE